jgi:tripartite-type tricarboxylate transporter receptor subunit TctC
MKKLSDANEKGENIMKTGKSWILASVGVLLMLALVFSFAYADSYPEKPITLLTAFSPGGGSDVIHRLIEKYAKKFIPQPFVIIYKPGAGGEFGWTELSLAKPDGYFIGGVDVPQIAMQPMLRKKGQPGYETEQLAPICGLVLDPHIICVHKNSKWKTLEEFMEYVRANPGKVTAATGGQFSGTHIFLMQFEFATGLKFAHIPFAGGGKSTAALTSQQVDCQFGTVNLYLRNEAARGLAITTPERYELCPDIPTMKEKGINLIFYQRRGLCAPQKTPADRIKYLEERLKQMSDLVEYKNDVKKTGHTESFMSAKEFGKFIQDEKVKMKAIFTKIGVLEK